MSTWPAAIACLSLAATVGSVAWFTWQARRITATRYWLDGEPVSRAEFEAAARKQAAS
ncbi:hypothetical protein GCM10010348_79090 [Streptomyces anthocyanicus]|uniref:hypothetical protein n=1 Tax=Streptomyces anthocyanicus TaxID=68174 RepID=UPI0018756CC0|nr:hypothetical protein [Streptomyces anthocyanicus]GHC39962.1 hypothetical protein GCM10010348_79090 [Streptomyces anthocyanicus]